MKKAFVTVLDSNFMKGFLVLMYSILKYNPGMDNDFYIIDTNLSKENKDDCQRIYKNIHFITPDYDSYKDFNWGKAIKSIQKSFYKLELFKMGEYDQVIAIDSDMLVIGDISYILNNQLSENPVYGVAAYKSSKDNTLDQINGGLIIVNSPLLNTETYNKMINHSKKGFSMVEQDAINEYFKGRIGFLPKEYNVEKRMQNSKRFNYTFDGTDARIIHYVSSKPWDDVSKKKGRERKYKELENLWWKHYEEAKNRYQTVQTC